MKIDGAGPSGLIGLTLNQIQVADDQAQNSVQLSLVGCRIDVGL